MKKSIIISFITAIFLLSTGCQNKNNTVSSTPMESLKSEPSSIISENSQIESSNNEPSFANPGESPNNVTLDEVGNKLISPNAERIAVSSGNLTLRSSESLDSLKEFYTSAAKSIGAVQDENPASTSTKGSEIAWQWVGSYNSDKTLDISRNCP